MKTRVVVQEKILYIYLNLNKIYSNINRNIYVGEDNFMKKKLYNYSNKN